MLVGNSNSIGVLRGYSYRWLILVCYGCAVLIKPTVIRYITGYLYLPRLVLDTVFRLALTSNSHVVNVVFGVFDGESVEFCIVVTGGDSIGDSIDDFGVLPAEFHHACSRCQSHQRRR